MIEQEDNDDIVLGQQPPLAPGEHFVCKLCGAAVMPIEGKNITRGKLGTWKHSDNRQQCKAAGRPLFETEVQRQS